MACPPEGISVGEGALQKILGLFWKRMKLEFVKKFHVN